MKQILFFTLAILLFSSCKKDNGAAASNPILGKWEIGVFKIHSYDPSYSPAYRDVTTTYPNENGNYIEFRNDNIAYFTFFDSSRGTSPYKVINNKILILNGDTLNITSIIENKFTTYRKEFVRYAYTEQWATYLR